MPVIVDAMGGDHAPFEIVKGAVEATREFDVEVILVGDRSAIEILDIDCSGVRIEHAASVIGMNEHPAKAVRRKPDSSIAIAARLSKGDGAALVSAGHTGAVMAAALLEWGRVPGIERPGIAAIIPAMDRNVVVLDVGANVDCKPSHLVQFAIMGLAYARQVLKVDNPKVGLLNIGEEEKKGNELTLACHKALSASDCIDFIGNCEPSAVYEGKADIVVTDGFAGNIFLKTSEAVSNMLQQILRSELSSSDVSASLFRRLGRYSTRNPQHAGAPLLGIEGSCIIAHGGSRAGTIKNCIALAHRFAESNTIQSIKKHVTS